MKKNDELLIVSVYMSVVGGGGLVFDSPSADETRGEIQGCCRGKNESFSERQTGRIQ